MDVFIGTVMPFPYNFVPRGWLACNGQILPIVSYTALFSLIGTYYGGNGQTHFALPHLNTTSNQVIILFSFSFLSVFRLGKRKSTPETGMLFHVGESCGRA